jgi:hypothetical protein
MSKKELSHLRKLEKDADYDGLAQIDAHWLLDLTLKLESRLARVEAVADKWRNLSKDEISAYYIVKEIDEAIQS